MEFPIRRWHPDPALDTSTRAAACVSGRLTSPLWILTPWALWGKQAGQPTQGPDPKDADAGVAISTTANQPCDRGLRPPRPPGLGVPVCARVRSTGTGAPDPALRRCLRSSYTGATSTSPTATTSRRTSGWAPIPCASAVCTRPRTPSTPSR